MAATKDLRISQGRTFTLALRWESSPIVYKAISAILNSAPVRITAEGHGIPDGWRVAVTSVKGMTEINAEGSGSEVSDRDFHAVTVIDEDTIEINDINAALFKTYTSGGHVQYNTPVSLTGMTARMSIKDKIGGTELLSLTTEDGRIDIDPVSRVITLSISAADTAAIVWKTGVYDLEMVSADVVPVVTALLCGKVSVTREVTTT